MIRGVRTPPKSRLHPIAMLENQESIQAALMEIVNALVRNQIDVPRARLVLRALSIAARHAGKARFDCFQSNMVNEVPEYPAAPPATGPFAIATVQAAALVFDRQHAERRIRSGAFQQRFSAIAREHPTQTTGKCEESCRGPAPQEAAAADDGEEATRDKSPASFVFSAVVTRNYWNVC